VRVPPAISHYCSYDLMSSIGTILSHTKAITFNALKWEASMAYLILVIGEQVWVSKLLLSLDLTNLWI
jgi:hypothetical protein